jgi:hypothetical protein
MWISRRRIKTKITTNTVLASPGKLSTKRLTTRTTRIRDTKPPERLIKNITLLLSKLNMNVA